MSISISSRVRNAMVGLAITLSILFTGFLFLLVYVIEDQVFVNQLKSEKLNFERSNNPQWQPENSKMRLIKTNHQLPEFLPTTLRSNIVQQPGVHEYFDDDKALFIAHFKLPDRQEPYYLIYDVEDLLAVRGTKTKLLFMISLLTALICAAAIYLAHRLAKQTLAPVRKLTHELKNSDFDDTVIDLANDFSPDEIGVLANELALALGRVRDSAQREYEFNRGVSHELRTPIQVAQSATELIELQLGANDDQLRRPVERLKRSVSEMNEVVDAFLWLASGRQANSMNMCMVSSLIALFNQYELRHTEVDWRLEKNISDHASYALPEPVVMVVMRSLIDNAIKHGDGQTISVALNEHSLSVKNQIDTDMHKDAKQAANSASFGIGLSLATRLCERFDCKLSVIEQGTAYKAQIELP